MARRNISLPEALDDLARARGLNVSALAQAAITEEIDRLDRMAALDAWLDELDALHGPPSRRAVAEAEAWARAAIPVTTLDRIAPAKPKRAVRPPRVVPARSSRADRAEEPARRRSS